MIVIRQNWVFGIAGAIVVVLALFCWQQLQLAHYFLAAPTWDRIRSEVAGGLSSQSLHYFRFTVQESTTWGELGAKPGLGLEPDLIVESFKCTTGDLRTLKLDAIGGAIISRGKTITVVLKRGACP